MKEIFQHKDEIKVIQITDSHLFSDNESEIFGVKSNKTFKSVIDKIKAEDEANTDLIFFTGDISQDETKESYQLAVNELSMLNIPVYWIPGNHDNLSTMRSVFEKSQLFFRKETLEIGNWNFVFLNSKKERVEYGHLPDYELEILKNTVNKKENQKNIVVVMHHHPIKVNTPLIDNYILKNTDQFWDIISHGIVPLIICGHVHGDYRIKNKNTIVEASPATCLQWKKGATSIEINNKIGYKIYQFKKDDYNSYSKLW